MDTQSGAGIHETISGQLRFLHDRLAVAAPDVERVTCALYDSDGDLLRTFISSSRHGSVLRGYEFKLSDSASLSSIAMTQESRLIADIPTVLDSSTAHSRHIRDEGFLASFTVPMHFQGEFLGMVFFDARRNGAFTPDLQRELVLYAQLITASVAASLVSVRSMVGTIHGGGELIEQRDIEAAAHLERMARYSRIIASALLEPLDLDDEFVEAVYLYAPLYDIGKIGIPDAILLKAGKLSAGEWEVMKAHTTQGRQLVDTMSSDLGTGALLRPDVLRNIVELHHEALDGSGYPHGLIGDQIPLEARIVAVADIFDALVSSRPYKPGWSVDQALEEMDRMVAAGRIDGLCLTALVAHPVDVEAVMDSHRDSVN